MTPARPGPAQASTLFQGLLGAAFFRLPPAVRRLHSVRGHARHAGRVTVERGTHPLARLCARIAHLPPAMHDAPLVVEFDAAPLEETWRRAFDDAPMASRLRLHDGLLQERLGALRLRFHVYLHDDALHWRVAGVRAFGVLPLPRAWFEHLYCSEREVDGRYAFEVAAVLPLAGLVVRYHGWLAPEGEADAPAAAGDAAHGR